MFVYKSNLYQLINNWIMIRGSINSIAVIGLLIVLTCSAHFQQLSIISVQRTVNLAGHYPTEATKIRFKANQDGVSRFSYLLPLEYDSKISIIGFTRSAKDRKILAFTRSIYIYEGTTFAHYEVALPSNYQIGQEGQLLLNILFINRYVNLPSSISLSEDQRLQYEDTKFLVTPYEASSQESIYRLAKIIEHDSDGEKKGLGQVTFSQKSTAPFSITKHIVFGVNNYPQVVFTEVQKTIDVSHWGNVGITENYKIVNTGPSLKGEFSRVTYGSRSQADAKNAFRGIEFDLPYEIWGLYFLDEVGNISSSKAYRDESSRSVHVALQPRFFLLGGWKSNWEIGYNLNTGDGVLFQDGNKFELHMKLEYALQKIIAEDYNVKLVLPYGSENVKIRIGGKDYDMALVETSTTEGYLDFNGRPTYVISNYHGLIKDKEVQVFYDYAPSGVYQKPISLFVIILGLLLVAIFASRFKLQAFAESKRSE